jgi:plastocyanin
MNGDPPAREHRRRTDIVIAAAAAATVVVAALTLLWNLGYIPERHPRPPETVINLSKRSGPVGTTVRVKGSGFLDNEPVMIFVHVFQVGTATTNDSGEFHRRIKIPAELANLPLPQVPVFARGVTSKRVAVQAFALGPPGTPPPPWPPPPPPTTTVPPPPPTGSGGTQSGGGGGSTVSISADPSGALKYEEIYVTATPGSITIDFTNMSSLPHDVTIEGDGATDTITGSTTSTTVDLESGTYKFFCSVDGHRAAGMEGKLTVS